jgi:type I restriction enzyme S subunit
MRPYLRAANVTWTGFDLRDVKQMNFTADESAVYELQRGDVLVAEASGSADEVGKPALWHGEIEGCCFQNTLIRVRSRGPIPEYLRYFLLTEAYSGRIGRASPGVGIHHIGAARLSAWRIPIPPLAEQLRIVAAIEEQLSRVDVARQLVNGARTRLNSLRRSILGAAVAVGEVAPLSDLLDGIEAGKSFGAAARRANAEEWGVIKVSAMTWGRFREQENKAVSRSAVDPRWEIQPGDLLVSRANTTEYVGAAVLVGDTRPRLLLSDKSLRLIVKEGVDKTWLLFALSAPQTRNQISEVASGTSDSMRNVSQEKLRSVLIRVPDSRQQAELASTITATLERVESMASALSGVSRRSDAIRRSILAQAFRGDLVPQDPQDEPASALLERIAAERAATPKPARKRSQKAPA